HTRCLSDWSSDVCSSDLFWLFRLRIATSIVLSESLQTISSFPYISSSSVSGPLARTLQDLRTTSPRERQRRSQFSDLILVISSKIGRASCRERVKSEVGD